MTSRREFIQSSFAATLVAGLGYVPGAFARGQDNSLALYKAIYDERFADSRRFAAEARDLGVATHAIKGDITDLWLHDLDARWRADKAVVAGMTTQAVLFCLERLSWDHQMRVVFRAEHEFAGAGCIEHTIACSNLQVPAAQALQRDGSRWAPRMAHLLRQVPAGQSPDSGTAFTTPLSGQHDGAELLVSWIIAPRTMAPQPLDQEQSS